MARHGLDAMLADASGAVAAEGLGSPWRMFAYVALGWARRLLGDPAAADAAWAEAISSAPPGTNVYLALASRASLAMARDDWETAVRLANESHDAFGSTHLGDVAPSLLVHAVAARAAVHAGDPARGRSELVHAQLARPQANHALPWMAVAGMLELARAYLTVSDVSGARSVVADAARIVRLRPGLGVLVTELTELRTRLADASETLMGSSTLTPAELRLLPFLPTYLSFEEIATRLQVSRHTIKTHAMAVYAKLQASSRSQAVERAVELGMIEPFPGLPVPSASLDPVAPRATTQVPAHVRRAPRHPGHETSP
jgi:LuxR family maltose regulon positive regulatory protein